MKPSTATYSAGKGLKKMTNMKTKRWKRTQHTHDRKGGIAGHNHGRAERSQITKTGTTQGKVAAAGEPYGC